jgi:hypothetical protein
MPSAGSDSSSASSVPSSGEVGASSAAKFVQLPFRRVIPSKRSRTFELRNCRV